MYFRNTSAKVTKKNKTKTKTKKQKKPTVHFLMLVPVVVKVIA